MLAERLRSACPARAFAWLLLFTGLDRTGRRLRPARDRRRRARNRARSPPDSAESERGSRRRLQVRRRQDRAAERRGPRGRDRPHHRQRRRPPAAGGHRHRGTEGSAETRWSPSAPSGTDRRTYDEVPAKYDSQTPRARHEAGRDGGRLHQHRGGRGPHHEGRARPSGSRRAARPSRRPSQLATKRKVRSVALGNGLYPSEERAEQFGISREELARPDVRRDGRRLRAAAGHRGTDSGRRSRPERSSGSPAPEAPICGSGIAGRPVHGERRRHLGRGSEAGRRLRCRSGCRRARSS